MLYLFCFLLQLQLNQHITGNNKARVPSFTSQLLRHPMRQIVINFLPGFTYANILLFFQPIVECRKAVGKQTWDLSLYLLGNNPLIHHVTVSMLFSKAFILLIPCLFFTILVLSFYLNMCSILQESTFLKCHLFNSNIADPNSASKK